MPTSTLFLGDCSTELAKVDPDSVDLAETSHSYVEHRAKTYGGTIRLKGGDSG